MMSPEFGQPDEVYDGPVSLITAVHNFPNRFSEETHVIVAELIAQELYVSNPIQELRK